MSTSFILAPTKDRPITPLSPSSPSPHIASVHAVFFICATSFLPFGSVVWFPVSPVHAIQPRHVGHCTISPPATLPYTTHSTCITNILRLFDIFPLPPL
ncbi:hypothetical protein VTO73DRAFT_8109 [Trametes versicolor]